MKKINLWILFMGFQFCCWTQTDEIDSLLNLTSNFNQDTFKVNHLLSLASKLSNTSTEESKKVTFEALELSRAIQFRRGEVISLHKLSNCLQIEGKLDSAKIVTLESLNRANEVGDSSLISHSGYLLGVIYSTLEDKNVATEYFYNAAGIAERNNDLKAATNCYNGLGVHLMGAREMDRSTKFLKLALETAKRGNLEFLATRQYINLSIALDDIDQSMALLDTALVIAEKNNHTRALAYIYNSLSDNYELQEDYGNAMKYLRKSIVLAEQTGDKERAKKGILDLGKLQYQIGLLDSAEYNLREFINENEMQMDIHGKISAFQFLSKVLYDKGEFENAYAMLDSSYTRSEARYSKNVADKVSEANAKYETEKKDAELSKQELELAKKDQIRSNLIGGGIILLLTLSGVFLWYFERQKRKKKETELALLEEQKEAEKLREIDDMKTQFFTNVSHELRTPLTLIMGPLADVMEKVEDGAIKKSIHLAHSNADRLLDMVNEVLDLSKLESGHIKIEKHEVELEPYIKRIFYAFESMAEIREITFDLDTKNCQKQVRIDEDKVEKILNNLISNAIKYSPNKSQVHMKAELVNNQLSVWVIDQGKGIHPHEQDKIFNRFYQSNLITAVEGGGTGVGLALSRELSELLGGSLSVESKLDEGSTFILKIPVEVIGHLEGDHKSPVQEARTSSYVPLLINGEKPKILIIEDNNEMRDYLHSLLEEEYRCGFAPDGYAALQMLQTRKYDIISSDIMMPNMDGFQLKEKVNELDGLNRIPFIFLTARSLDEDRIAGLRLGVDDYITKPFNKYEYRARIHNLLKNKLERDEWLLGAEGQIATTDNIEEEILKSAEKSIERNIANPNFIVNDLASDLNYSQRQLARIIKRLTGMTPVNFILELRLQRAFQLLKSKSHHNVSEVMYEVGIESASYFARKFKERFGLSPGEVK